MVLKQVDNGMYLNIVSPETDDLVVPDVSACPLGLFRSNDMTTNRLNASKNESLCISQYPDVMNLAILREFAIHCVLCHACVQYKSMLMEIYFI